MKRDSEEERIEAMAAAWIAQKDDGMTSDQVMEFDRWRASDPKHEAAVLRLEHTWKSLQRLCHFRPEASRHPDRDLLVPRNRSFAGWFTAFGLLAGTAALIVALLVVRSPEIPREKDSAILKQTIATQSDGFQRLRMPDGSVFTLNGGSELRVSFNPSERRVTLLRGEAHFQVFKDAARPFCVEAGTMTVRAVGTAFKVRLEAEAVDVLVTEGRVQVDDTRVSSSNTEQADDASVGMPGAFLDAGERLRIAHDAALAQKAIPVVERLQPELIHKELAWQDAWLSFADTPLGVAVAQFNARNRVQIVLMDSELASLPIGGTFRAENVEGFARLLASSGHLDVEHSAPERIIFRSRRNQGKNK